MQCCCLTALLSVMCCNCLTAFLFLLYLFCSTETNSYSQHCGPVAQVFFSPDLPFSASCAWTLSVCEWENCYAYCLKTAKKSARHLLVIGREVEVLFNIQQKFFEEVQSLVLKLLPLLKHLLHIFHVLRCYLIQLLQGLLIALLRLMHAAHTFTPGRYIMPSIRVLTYIAKCAKYTLQSKPKLIRV